MKFSKLFFIALIIFFLTACDSYQSISNDVKNYNVQNIFLNTGETSMVDIYKQFEKSNINISKYELSSTDDKVASVSRNTIKGHGSGKISINGVLYSKSNSTKYLVRVAEVYVINPDDLIEIKTATDLANMKNNKNGKYILKSDIDLADFGTWQSIGNYPAGNEFTGIFVNPDGYKIRNLQVSSSQELYKGPYGGCQSGLFGSIKDAYIDGIILENVFIDISDFDAEYKTAKAGGIAGTMLGSMIRNCQVSGTVIAQYFAGGIVASNSWGTIIGCSYNGVVMTVNSTNYGEAEVGAGGIVGYSYNDDRSGYIKDCYMSGEVSGHVIAGGIVGTNKGQLINCSAIVTLKGASFNNLIGRSQ